MNRLCPECGASVPDDAERDECHAEGCHTEAVWEGYYRVKDPLLGTPTGLIQLRRVCDEHRCLLIGGKKEKANV